MAEDGEEWLIFSVQSGQKYLFQDAAGQNMPNKFSGRYQSRLFSYLNRQYLRWSEKSDRALRHGQVATTWGAQVILYPVFVLFQSAQLAGKRLQQFLGLSSAPSAPQLPPSDMPVRRVLEVAESFYLPAAATENTRKESINSSKPLSFTIKGRENQSPITGIASEQEKGNLVLVSQENEILDILTPEQQQQLNEQIIFEVESYLQQGGSINQVADESRIILAPNEVESQMGLPGRIVKNAIDWVKTGPVGAVVNLFPEENQLLNQFDNRRQQLKAKSQELKQRHQQLKQKSDPTAKNTDEIEPDFISNIDRAIAKLEAFTVTPFAQITQQLMQQLKTRFGNAKALVKNETAITLGKGQISENLEDPWLTTNDLFDQAKALPNATNKNSATTASLPPSKQPEFFPINNNIQNLINRYLQPKQSLAVRPQQQSDLAVSQNSTGEIAKVESSGSSLQTNSNSKKSVTSTGKVNKNLEPEWIETEAKPVGYVKHPLERILELLDRGMLWLEEILLQVWQWLQSLMKNKN